MSMGLCPTRASRAREPRYQVWLVSALTSSRVARQSALWVSRQPIASDYKAPGFIQEDGFFHLRIMTMFTVGESPPNISGK